MLGKSQTSPPWKIKLQRSPRAPSVKTENIQIPGVMVRASHGRSAEIKQAKRHLHDALEPVLSVQEYANLAIQEALHETTQMIVSRLGADQTSMCQTMRVLHVHLVKSIRQGTTHLFTRALHAFLSRATRKMMHIQEHQVPVHAHRGILER